MVSFRLDDEVVDVPNDALHLSAASYIRQYTHCKASHPQPVATADLQLATYSQAVAIMLGITTLVVIVVT
jgi:hypothetical protein